MNITIGIACWIFGVDMYAISLTSCYILVMQLYGFSGLFSCAFRNNIPNCCHRGKKISDYSVWILSFVPAESLIVMFEIAAVACAPSQ
jgi:hypothetical protein